MRRATIVGLLLATLCAITPGSAPPPPPDPTLLLRWPTKADAEESHFEGGDFRALSPAPIVGNGAFSVSVWVNAADLAGGDATYGRGIARSTRGEQVGDWLLSVHRDGRVRFCNWRTKGDDKQGSHVTRKPLVAPAAWMHLAATWDGTANRIYVNGALAVHDAGATAAGWGTGHEVGRCWTAPGYFWDGQIHNLRVYRRALAAADITGAFKAGPGVSARSETGPAGDVKVSQVIDRIILAKLKQAGVRHAPPADDEAFHRRVNLDLIGRIPIPAETEAFVAEKEPDERRKLIEALLAGREMPIAWARILSGWLMPKEGRRDAQFVAWLRGGLARNKSWDRFAREMLVANSPGPASLFLGYRRASLKDNSIAGDVGRAFFGVNLRCAACHDHPHVREWTLERFYGLAAFFARTYEHSYRGAPNPGQTTFAERGTGELEYTANGKKQIAKLMFLDGRVIAEPALPKDFKEPRPLPNVAPVAPPFSRREALMRVALEDKSKLFSRAIVNRVWQRLMGRGLVEPVDMMYKGNSATHPELLDLLANDFAANKYNLRRLIATIVQSDAYARSSRWTGKGKLPAETLYAVAVLKPLDANQMALSLPLATGYYDAALTGTPKRTMAQLRSLAPWQTVVAEFESEADKFEPTTSQALFLTNSNYVQTNFLAKSNLAQALSRLTEDKAVVRSVFVSVLSRLPTPDEIARVSRYLRQRGTKARVEACRELVWALVTGAEFRFNH